MDIRIESLHFEATKELKDFITKKLEKIEKVCHLAEYCHVILRLDHSDTRKNKIAEVILNIPKHRFFAKEQDNTFEGAANKAIEDIRSQLISHKEKFAGHRAAADQEIENRAGDGSIPSGNS